MEALNLKMGLTSTQLDHALKRVAAGDGLNSNFDLEVTWLSEVPKSVWEGMQTVAEEKCKAYCCVVGDLQYVYKLLQIFHVCG